ncbi:MAG: tRNA-(ms[2]io[6]A)-hydroxylase [Bacteroidota bacterium]
MKMNLDIGVASKAEWIDCVMDRFDEFLIDHADCERKASAMAMSFVAKYPDRKAIIPELIDTAIEELEHFQQVYQLMEKRGIALPASMGKDEYVADLIKRCHSGREERFMDRMLIASVVETRGAERFRMVADHLEKPELKRFYKTLWTSEAKHGHIFVKMLLNYFPAEKVYPRLEWWVEQEAEIIDGLPIRPALH